MGDFSASANRRLKTQETFVSNVTPAAEDLARNMASEYRPFSTIISNKDEDEEIVRPSLYGVNSTN